eukprot:1054032-Rhodomonas_salina.1
MSVRASVSVALSLLFRMAQAPLTDRHRTPRRDATSKRTRSQLRTRTHKCPTPFCAALSIAESSAFPEKLQAWNNVARSLPLAVTVAVLAQAPCHALSHSLCTCSALAPPHNLRGGASTHHVTHTVGPVRLYSLSSLPPLLSQRTQNAAARRALTEKMRGGRREGGRAD